MPRVSVSGLTLRISTAPSPVRAASTGCRRGIAEFVGHRDMRRVVDKPPDEIGLRTLHQRRDRQEERDSEHDPGQRDDALARAARADASARSPARARALPSSPAVDTGRTACPALSPAAGAATMRSPSARPERISTSLAPLAPSVTCDRRQLAVLDAPHRVLPHRAGRHEQRIVGLAQHDIGLGRHADHQRRIGGSETRTR